MLIPPYALALLFGGLLPAIAALWFGWPLRLGDEVAQHMVRGTCVRDRDAAVAARAAGAKG